MQGERRTVTMLFADIKGSTAAAEQMDPEDWATVVNGAFEHLISPVYRYEGTLAHLQGDAVLAFFGAPMAHEDDPVRAIRAGLEIVESMRSYSAIVEREWAIPIEVRVGINTGLVVVGEVGSDLRVEYTALGDAINVAARMEQTAEPGTVRVSSTTLSLTGEVFEVEDLGAVEVKGKSEPVTAHRVIRFVGGEGVEVDQPIVGRDQELGLFTTLRSTLLSGTGWITSVIGEAGLGKTRLLSEVRRLYESSVAIAHVFDEPGDIAWMFGTSRSYDSSKPLSTIRDLLGRWWGTGDQSGDFARVEAAARASGLGDGDTAALLGYVGGVALPEEARSFIDALETSALHSKTTAALSSYFEALASQRPLIVVLEDLHWADDLSLATVEGIMDLTETSAVGLVVALRPYRDEPTWRIHEVADRDHHHRYHLVDLEPLGPSESTRLVEALVEKTGISEEVRKKILDRSDGNPLFIEEMVRSIGEVGEDPADLTIPANLTAMLTARLDRLDEESRFVAQTASVLGVDFERDTLEALLAGSTSPDRTSELLRRGILVQGGATSRSLSFRHALIREAAYSTILRRTRRQLHRRVADHLAERTPRPVEDIALHLVEANELDEAFPYLIEAGLAASRSMALADAIRLLSLAVDNTPMDADPDLVERAHEALGEAYALVPDLSLAAAAYQRLYRYGEDEERPSARVAALNHLGYATASLGADLEGASRYLDQARALAEEVGDELGLAQYHMNACFVASMGGQIAKAAAHDEATVDLGEKSGVESIRLAGLVRRAVNYAALLDVEKAGPAVETALEAAAEAGHEESRAVLVCFGSAVLAMARGELQSSVDMAIREQSNLERYSSFYTGMNLRNIGELLHYLGDLEGSLSHYMSGKRLADQLGQSFVAGATSAGWPWCTQRVSVSIPELRAEAHGSLDGPMGEFLASTIWADLGFTSLMSGEPEVADTEFSTGLAASSISQFHERPRLLGGQALARIRIGELEGIESLLDEAWTFVRQRSYVTHDPLLHLAQGELEMGRGQFGEADESLVLAQSKAMEFGLRLLTVRVLEARARLSLAAGMGATRPHVETARSIVEALAATIADEMLRDRFMATQMKPLESVIAGPIS
jgi:class 3 adenylate cyclase/tetratricopeptide (TPR) repeat protein